MYLCNNLAIIDNLMNEWKYGPQLRDKLLPKNYFYSPSVSADKHQMIRRF